MEHAAFRRLVARYQSCSYSCKDDRDRPIVDLLRDPDPRFRPSRRLIEIVNEFDAGRTKHRYIYQLDRAIIPLLNALVRLGLVTNTSCAGHLRDPGHAPHLSVDGLSRRATRAMAVLGHVLPYAQISHSVYRHEGFPVRLYMRTTIVWGSVNPHDRRRTLTAEALSDSDRRVLSAACELDRARTWPPLSQPSTAGRLVLEIAERLASAPPTGDFLLPAGDVVAVRCLDERGRAARVRLECDIRRHTASGWSVRWQARCSAESHRVLRRSALYLVSSRARARIRAAAA